MNTQLSEHDLLDLKPFADKLEKFIRTEQEYVDGGLVVALSSKFGSGKTTFLEMWKANLENQEDVIDTPFVILLNAWESDYYGDPLFAIISSLVHCLEESGEKADAIIDAAKDLGWFSLAIGNQVVQKVTGIDAVAAGELAEEKKAKRESAVQLPSDTFSAYQDRKDAMRHLKEAIQRFVDTTKPVVLFLVDELDRCRPDYAISYLETIKHIFDIHGAVFILAADRQQLQNSARMAFGPKLDFEEYYRKFVHREVALPQISDTCYRKLANAYVPRYLRKEGVRRCMSKIDGNYEDFTTSLIGALKLTPRQIQEVFRILGHTFDASQEDEGKLRWLLTISSVAMASFKVGNPQVFQLLGTQQYDSDEAFNYLKELLHDEAPDWWFTLFLTGGGIKIDPDESEEDILTKYGIIQKDSDLSNRNYIGQFHSGWGHATSSRFVQIHDMIEHISQWR